MMRINKYGNKRTNGFDSKLEEKRYNDLMLLEKAGKISRLQRQVKILLTTNHKTARESVSYIADFVYFEGEDRIIEDAKGYKTDVYKVKLKILLDRFEGFIFREYSKDGVKDRFSNGLKTLHEDDGVLYGI